MWVAGVAVFAAVMIAALLGATAACGATGSQDDAAATVDQREAELDQREADLAEAEREAAEAERDEAERKVAEAEARVTKPRRKAAEAEAERDAAEAEVPAPVPVDVNVSIDDVEVPETVNVPAPPPHDPDLIPPGVIEDGVHVGYVTDFEGWEFTFDRADVAPDGSWTNTNTKLRTLPMSIDRWQGGPLVSGMPIEIHVQNQRVVSAYILDTGEDYNCGC